MGNGSNQYGNTGKPTRTVKYLIRLTEDERATATHLAFKYGATIADVLRAGIYAFEREDVREAMERAK